MACSFMCVLIPVSGCSKLRRELWNLSHFYLQFMAGVEEEIQKQGGPLEKEFKVSSAEVAACNCPHQHTYVQRLQL